MEFFVPSLFVFVLSLVVTFLIAPRMTPLVASVLAIALLTYGVYDHYRMFAVEYRLSTWQDGLQMYSPAIMIGAILLFIIYGILAFFTSGKVPIPNINLPNTNTIANMNLPNMNTLTNNVVNTVNDAVNTTANMFGNMGNTVGNALNTATNSLGLGGNNHNKGSRSFLETV